MSPRRRSRHRRRDVARRAGAILALVGLVASIGSVLLFAGGDSGQDPSATTSSSVDLGPTTTLDRDALTDQGRELVDLIEVGRDETYHVLYQVPQFDPADSDVTATIEIWRRGDQVRIESVRTDETGTGRRIDIGGPEGNVSCDENPGEELTCELGTEGPLEPTEDVLALVLGLLPDSEVTAEDAIVGTVSARCFTLQGDRTSRICLTPAGVLVLYDDGTVHLEATLVDQTVTDETFVPPGAAAPPADPAPSTTGG